MLTAHTFDGLSALIWNEVLAAYERTGTVEGCGISLTTSDTAIDIDVASGTTQVDGTTINVTAQSVTLPANESSLPRRDVVWIDDTGTAQYREGNPEPYQPSRDTDGDFQNDIPARQTVRPAPDDMADILRADPPTGTVQATVVVPPWTDAASDLTNDDWTDRIMKVPSTAGSGSHDDLTDVSTEDHQPQRYAGANLANNASTFDVIDAANGGTIDADSVDGYDVFVQNTVPDTTDPYLRFEDQ